MTLTAPPMVPIQGLVVSTASQQSVGKGNASTTATAGSAVAWPAANRAIYIPFQLHSAFTVVEMACNFGTASGNVDLGIYSEAGTRLVSTGSTATTTATPQVFDVTDTVLSRGRYYLAMAVDNTTATAWRFVPAAIMPSMMGVLVQDTAFVLPSTATFARDDTLAYLPVIMAASQTVLL